MSWMVMKLVFMSIPTQPMLFFVRPIARLLCSGVQVKLPQHQQRRWAHRRLSEQEHLVPGEHLTMADFR